MIVAVILGVVAYLSVVAFLAQFCAFNDRAAPVRHARRSAKRCGC